MSKTSGWYAAIGTDGMRPVVWGVGESEQAAREDACLCDELTHDDLDALTLRPITDEQAVRIQRGEVDCKTLGI